MLTPCCLPATSASGEVRLDDSSLHRRRRGAYSPFCKACSCRARAGELVYFSPRSHLCALAMHRVGATVSPTPQPVCSSSTQELLRTLPGAKVTDACPTCLRAGVTVAIAFHPSASDLRAAAAAAAARPSAVEREESLETMTVDFDPTEAASQPPPPPPPKSSTPEIEEAAPAAEVPKEMITLSSSSASAAAAILPAPVPRVKSGETWRENASCADGQVYTGATRYGCASGFGVCVKPNTSWRYEGEWIANRREGQGRQVEEDGTIYEGAFVQGRRHGTGQLFDKDGRLRLKGVWKDGVLHQTDHTEPEQKKATTPARPPPSRAGQTSTADAQPRGRSTAWGGEAQSTPTVDQTPTPPTNQPTQANTTPVPPPPESTTANPPTRGWLACFGSSN